MHFQGLHEGREGQMEGTRQGSASSGLADMAEPGRSGLLRTNQDEVEEDDDPWRDEPIIVVPLGELGACSLGPRPTVTSEIFLK